VAETSSPTAWTRTISQREKISSSRRQFRLHLPCYLPDAKDKVDGNANSKNIEGITCHVIDSQESDEQYSTCSAGQSVYKETQDIVPTDAGARQSKAAI
jgi:hypothetical protein